MSDYKRDRMHKSSKTGLMVNKGTEYYKSDIYKYYVEDVRMRADSALKLSRLIISLSGGTLVLSLTFLKDFIKDVRNIQAEPCIIMCWVILLLATFFGIMRIYHIDRLLKKIQDHRHAVAEQLYSEEGKEISDSEYEINTDKDTKMDIFSHHANYLSLFLFLAGIIFFAIFVYFNLF